MADDSSTCTRYLYLSPSELCLIKRISKFKVSYLNLDIHTRTRPRAYARARTLAARQSVQSMLGGYPCSLCPRPGETSGDACLCDFVTVIAAHVGGHGWGSPRTRSYPELLRVTGPLAVARTSDRGRVAEG